MGDENLDEKIDKKTAKPVPEDLDLDDEAQDVEEWIGDEDWGEEEEIEQAVEAEPEIPQYIDNGDGTISDPQHNLMWLKTDSFKDFGYGITWTEALDYCENVNDKGFAGHSDWRLPSFEEARTLFSYARTNVDKGGAEIHIDPLFESGGGHNTWTYEEKPDYQQYALKFNYITGNEIWEHKDNEYSHARIVRDEQKEEWEPKWRKSSRKFDH